MSVPAHFAGTGPRGCLVTAVKFSRTAAVWACKELVTLCQDHLVRQIKLRVCSSCCHLTCLNAGVALDVQSAAVEGQALVAR